jgi:hypothetical protein
MASLPISHALVLPDKDFMNWYNAADAYSKAFERVAVIRSPAGNDLNRFRNITAVQTPGVWVNDNALTHIRQVYPMVVRVDIIRASTPADLARALQDRITNKDRYGERIQDGHINDRFTLDWPSDYRPARIVNAFNADLGGGRKNEGLDISAPVASKVFAAAPGTVATIVRQATALGYGPYVQIATILNGQSYLVTYTQLQTINVTMGQTVKVGDQIGESGWQTIKIVVQQPGKGLSGYVLPDVVDPTMMIYWQGMRLKITSTSLRIRERPGTDFQVVGQLYPADRSETLEPHGRTLLKVGIPDQWIKIRSPQGVEGFCSSEYLAADETTITFGALNMTGMNLDMLHRLGKPDPARLKGTGWVRFAYNVSMGRGSQDLDAAYNFYAPLITAYAKAGLKVILCLTHQTYGEGAGYVWPQMDVGKWHDLTAKYCNFIRQIAARFAGKDLVAVYQIWNEQDTPGQGQAAVSMPPQIYGYLLGEAIKTLRSADPKARIITGGHVGGPGTGAAYARTAIAALPSGVLPDGIACHSYGRGPVGSIYSPFGSIDEDVEAYSKILPNAPVWITEWGVLDRNNDPATGVADYATGFISRLKTLYSSKVAAAVWYAWADTMHNGYGLVGSNDQPKQPLCDRFLKA